MFEKGKEITGDLIKKAYNLVESFKEDKKRKEWDESSFDQEQLELFPDPTDLLDILNDAFPGVNFTADNILEVLADKNITRGDFLEILECYSWCPGDKEPRDIIPEGIKAKFRDW